MDICLWSRILKTFRYFGFFLLQPDDDYNHPAPQIPETKTSVVDKDNDDLDDDIFNGLNPDDGLGIGLDDL